MEGKYSLIFMADNGKTARLRLGPALLRSLVTLLALLPIVAGVSLWLNWKLYEDRRSVLAENSLLRATVDSNAQTVARLSGLEQFLQQAAPESLGDLVAVTDVPPAPGMDTGTEGADEATPSASAAPASTETPAPVSNNASTEQGAGAVSDVQATPSTASTIAPSATSPTAPAADAASAAVAPPLPTASSAEAGTSSSVVANGSNASSNVDLEPAAAAAADSVDNGFARVESLSARRVGSRSLRISFDLFNTGQVPQLAGHTTFELITKEGTRIGLPAHGDTTYRINRLKKIVGNPSLPADVTDTSGASVLVSIYADKELIFRVTTPLQ